MTLILLAFLACGPKAPADPSALALDDADAAGRALSALPPGLYRIDDADARLDTAIIAVHGLDSRGTEWAHPLEILEQQGVEVWWYGWKDRQCPDTGAAELAAALDGFVSDHSGLERLIVVGHSYGGLISTLAAQDHSPGVPEQLHIVASPLGEHPQLQKLCKFNGVENKAAAEGTTWHQWRTVHEQDGAFKDLEVDPQVVELPDLEVTQLPGEWKGERLGHNRSLTWFAEEVDVVGFSEE
ncbi:MAG: alpha/beta hydrolase [Alphaproteobacteria bacterium]|nr:alpha/beta hydrolase [Alphaproteobacteria bacterium]